MEVRCPLCQYFTLRLWSKLVQIEVNCANSKCRVAIRITVLEENKIALEVIGSAAERKQGA